MTENEDSYGRKRFKLGVVELAIVAIAIGVLAFMVRNQYLQMISQQTSLTTQVTKLTTQVAVLTDHITTLNAQLADVPTLTREMAKVQATQDEYGRRITALEDRGVKVKGWEH